MKIPDCYYRISIKALVLDGQKRFLLMREIDGTWDFPGGGLEFGEEPIVALKREINEETGIKVKNIIERPAYFVTAYDEDRGVHNGNVFYEVELDSLDFKPSDECQELRFFSVEDVDTVKSHSKVKEFAKLYRPNDYN